MIGSDYKRLFIWKSTKVTGKIELRRQFADFASSNFTNWPDWPNQIRPQLPSLYANTDIYRPCRL